MINVVNMLGLYSHFYYFNLVFLAFERTRGCVFDVNKQHASAQDGV